MIPAAYHLSGQTTVCKKARNGLSQSLGTAGDDCDFAFETLVQISGHLLTLMIDGDGSPGKDFLQVFTPHP